MYKYARFMVLFVTADATTIRRDLSDKNAAKHEYRLLLKSYTPRKQHEILLMVESLANPQRRVEEDSCYNPILQY